MHIPQFRLVQVTSVYPKKNYTHVVVTGLVSQWFYISIVWYTIFMIDFGARSQSLKGSAIHIGEINKKSSIIKKIGAMLPYERA